MYCPECGYKNNDKNKFCLNCGKNISQEAEKINVKKMVVVDESIQTDSLLRDIFLFLENEDWKRADEYCERVLDIEPECAQAYLVKMMAEMKICKKSEIPKAKFYGKSVNYNKMLKYADYDLKKEIMSYNKCWLYNWAESIRIHSKSENEFLKAEAVFLYLDDFLDSKNKAEQCEKHNAGISVNSSNVCESGVCPECGYHNSPARCECIKCGKKLKENSQIPQTDSYSQISDNISCETISINQSTNSNYAGEQNQAFYQDNNSYESNPYMTYKRQIYTKDAQIKRIVIGIVSIVVSPIIVILSSVAGVLGAVLSVNTIAGITGIFVSLFLLTGGIISIAARKNRVGSITSSAFLCAAAAVSFLGTGVYADWDISFFDLRTWSYVSYILASTAVGTLNEKERPEDRKQCIESWILESTLGVLLAIIVIETIKG